MPGTETNFERTFSDLAYTTIREKAPTLLNHLVGFQLIEKDENDTHAVGVFGFKLGGDYLFAPVFFLNGELKGTELLYIKSRDSFVPLQENWINYLLNRRPRILGELEEKSQNELGIRQPHFRQFAIPPSIITSVKTSSLKELELDQVLPRMLDPVLRGGRFKVLDEAYDVPSFLKNAGVKTARKLAAQFKEDPKFAEAVLKFYDIKDLLDPHMFEKRAKISKDAADYQDSASFSQCKDCKNFSAENNSCAVVEGDVAPNGTCRYFAVKGVENKIEPIQAKPAVFLRDDIRAGLVDFLTDGQKEAALKYGHVVVDPREEREQAKLFHAKLAESITSPSQDGAYEVIMEDGETKPMLISTKRDSFKKLNGCREVLLLDPETKRAYKAEAQGIPVRKEMDWTETDKLFKRLNALSGLSVGDCVIFVGPHIESTCPLEITQKNSVDGHTEYRVSSAGWMIPTVQVSDLAKQLSRNLHPRNPDYETNPGSYDGEITHVVLTERQNSKALHIGDTLFLPDTYRAMKLSKEDSQEPLRIARIDEVTLKLINLTSNGSMTVLKASSDGGRSFMLEVNGNRTMPLNKSAAVKELVMGCGLSEKSAELVLQQARPSQSPTYFVKKAWGLETGIQPAQFVEPPLGIDQTTGTMQQYPMSQIQPLGTVGRSNRYLYDPIYGADKAREFATNAAGQGQKEVLDTAVIAGLVDTLDVDNLIDKYIPDLLLALDRVGRILMLFYWHNTKFKERYGQQDLLEMEDNLRNVFKILGDLTLFLKQKTINPEMADSEAKLDEVLA